MTARPCQVLGAMLFMVAVGSHVSGQGVGDAARRQKATPVAKSAPVAAQPGAPATVQPSAPAPTAAQPQPDVPAVGQDPAGCTKLVAKEFCLGGPASSLPEFLKDDVQRPDGGAYQRDGLLFLVETFEGKVVSIIRGNTKETPSWLTVLSLEQTLKGIYGEPKDDSVFPDYADDRDSRSTAIHLGRARYKKVWSQPGYEVWLLWSGNYCMVSYHTPDWERKQKSKAAAEL